MNKPSKGFLQATKLLEKLLAGSGIRRALGKDPFTPQPAARSKPPEAAAIIRLQKHSRTSTETDYIRQASCRQPHSMRPPPGPCGHLTFLT